MIPALVSAPGMPSSVRRSKWMRRLAVAGGTGGLGLGVVLGLVPVSAHGSEEWFDRLSEVLTVSSTEGRVRARISGTLDLEAYGFSQPAPGLIDSSSDTLFSPRLTTFLDLQLGEHAYGFLQYRVDRGFDPGEHPLRGRIDEYALRVTPWKDGRFNLQVGQFATVVGNWVARHGSWENPFITAPLAYEQLTGIWDSVAAPSTEVLLAWSHVRPPSPEGEPATDKHLRVPLVWGPTYGTGVAIAGELGQITWAMEAKDTSLSSRPSTWGYDAFEWQHPTVSGRVGWRPNAMWNLGFSASSGSYLIDEADPTLAPGYGRGDYREEMLAQDISFAWHHLQIWAEFFETRFTIPTVTNADVFSYYIEAKYKFAPQWAGAVRWNEQIYGEIPDPAGGEIRWGASVRRLDVGPIYRFSANAQLKLQYSLQYEEGEESQQGHVLAAQLTVRF